MRAFGFLQLRQSVEPFFRFDARAQPDIRRPNQSGVEFYDAGRALREHLKRVLERLIHDAEHRLNEAGGDGFMEQVAHRVHEHEPRGFPPERFFQYGLVKGAIEPVPVFVNPHCLEPGGHALGVAMLAAVADLRAARHRVPRSLGPFDARLR